MGPECVAASGVPVLNTVTVTVQLCVARGHATRTHAWVGGWDQHAKCLPPCVKSDPQPEKVGSWFGVGRRKVNNIITVSIIYLRTGLRDTRVKG